MAVPLLDLQRQYKTIKDSVDAEVLRVIGMQRFIMGPDVDALEADVAAYVNTKNAIACASGTDAILLALKALPMEPGAEVIAPTFTFFATAGAIWNAGFKPVFIDVDTATFNITAETVRKAITPRTRAVVGVHLYGQMAPMKELMDLCREHDLFFVEDAAQSLGARQRVDGADRHAGTVGTIGTYSFFPSKNLGGFGDGGMMTTEDEEIATKLRKLRVHGGQQMYRHEMVGTNSRLDALQAAVLRAKLPHLDGWAEARRKNAAFYNDAFAGSDAIQAPVTVEGNHHVFNQYTLRVERRDELKKHLDARGIGNSIYYPLGLHLQECFAELGGKPGDLPVSEKLTREVISIPVFPELTDSERDQVVESVLDFYK